VVSIFTNKIIKEIIMAKNDSKKDKKNTKSKTTKSKNMRIKELEAKIKSIEKSMFSFTKQLSERNAALLRKMK
jgi:hypothetical protein